jgi:hypothetical protein
MRTGLKEQHYQLLPFNEGVKIEPGGLLKITVGEFTHEVECGEHVLNLESGNVGCIIRPGQSNVFFTTVRLLTQYMLVEIDGLFFLLDFNSFNQELSEALSSGITTVEG